LYREIREILTELKKFTWNCRSFAGVYTHVQDCKLKGTERNPMGDLAERHRLCLFSLSWRSSTEKYWGLTRGEFRYYICELDRQEEREKTNLRETSKVIAWDWLPSS
jgi:hypothetical protein